MWKGKITEETSNSQLVDKAWKKESDYICNWFTEEVPITKLRFIIRDGQRVLQAEYKVRVKFSEPLLRLEFGNIWYADTEFKYMWLDVPLEEE